jgi:methylenetetrahydrofolate dehydrogenase (NADP+)/methenyltetrahydrofolate cyclohydrolase
MTIINGIEIAQEIIARLKNQPLPQKYLAAVLVGDDPASMSFIRQKEKVGKELGVDFKLYQLPGSISELELKETISKITSEEKCGGILIQLPLPPHINREAILNSVPKEKDVDVLGNEAASAFISGENLIHPPAVAVVEEIAARLKINLESTKVAVIGVGILVGKPIQLFLENKAAAVEAFHRSSGEFQKQLKDFDLIISGAGQARLFGVSDLHRESTVIDFGYDQFEGKMAGDFDPRGAEEAGIRYTPTPGGTGPILVAKLYENFFSLEQN